MPKKLRFEDFAEAAGRSVLPLEFDSKGEPVGFHMDDHPDVTALKQAGHQDMRDYPVFEEKPSPQCD